MGERKTFLDRALGNYKVAELTLQTMSNDDVCLDICAYHLQQTIELVLKYILELNGIEYPKTHKIEQLIQIAADNDVDLFLTEYIDDHSEMLSSWEAESRYKSSFSVELRKLNKAIKEIGVYLDIVQKNLNSNEESLNTLNLF